MQMSILVEVWGDYACFSRPEMKVERVSYDVMTPSAARGLLEAIYWHPGMRWIIDSIVVCNPIRFTNIRRNEVTDVVLTSSALSAMNGGKDPLYLIASEKIAQRATMALRDVRYVINAHFVMTDKANATDSEGKFCDIIRRRLKKGQTYHQPCFGTREFIAHFKQCDSIPECPEELRGEKDLGWILLDMDYSDKEDIKPVFFRAVLHDGVLTVPDPKSEVTVR
ncbi:MAG: type I-C CRISPR-associated protein Cas5 [Lachnospiraceae bacterium]|nr:type I-C CRISPR-associated protein Cas5 [Lachnospiraceae bacterium]